MKSLHVNTKNILKPGLVFHQLTVIGIEGTSLLDKDGWPTTPSKWKYVCECVCGNSTIVSNTHLTRKTGKPTKSCGCACEHVAKSLRKSNAYEILPDGVAKVYFNNSNTFFLLDKKDLWVLKNYCWHKGVYGYAESRERNGGKAHIKLHRLLTEHPSSDLVVDHINRNRLDNRQVNLRVVDRKTNSRNRTDRKSKTGFRGVEKTTNGKFMATINLNGVHHSLGRFLTPEKAYEARVKAEKKYWGEGIHYEKEA